MQVPGDPVTHTHTITQMPTPHLVIEIASPQTRRGILGLTAVLTKQNTICWCGKRIFEWTWAVWNLKKVKGLWKDSCKPCGRLYHFWWYSSLSISLSLSLSHTHTHTHTHSRDTLSQARISFYRRETQVCWWCHHIENFAFVGNIFNHLINRQCMLGVCP